MASKHLNFWSVAIIIFLLDRITKLLVLNYIPLNSSIQVLPFFSLTHILNTGTAFGLLKNAQWFFLIFASAVSAFIIVKYQTFQPKIQLLSALVLGGALGNLFDRLFYGAVIDFINFSFWPAFNIADSAISIAVVLLLYCESKRNI
ncbi:MAG TPA: signal peptidase II [Candidatus Nanoarchaeia archaeon]|nr:signal peptidase II [Candidatus Nanoarchaeia archaeon]